MKYLALIISGIVALFSLVWLAEIVVANQIAQRDFSSEPCWFIQEDRPINMPELVAGPQGIYVPNPLRQINRRFIGLGLSDPEVLAPHFAVAALDAKGRPALWGWSYRKIDFWSLTEKSQSRRTGPLADFISEEAIRAACPTLAPPINPKRLAK
ncbi:MAG: hypothetical protein ACRECW_18595 [Phyllobacterium sp.]